MKIIQYLVLTAMTLVAGLAFATDHAQITPVGVWHSIDDKTNQPKAEIRIFDAGGGVLNGKIERGLEKDARADEICDLCTDDRKDKPKIGLELIRDAKKVDGKDVWEGGTIVDPDNGTVYQLKMTPIEGGKRLEIRAFIGFSLLGRTQTWTRIQ